MFWKNRVCIGVLQKLRLKCLPALSGVVSRVLGADELSLKDDCDMQIKFKWPCSFITCLNPTIVLPFLAKFNELWPLCQVTRI